MSNISITILCLAFTIIGAFIGYCVGIFDKNIKSLPISRMPSRVSLFTVHGWELTRTVLKNDMEYVLSRFDSRLLPTVMSAIDLAYTMGKEENK
jgi:hypothetical protein